MISFKQVTYFKIKNFCKTSVKHHIRLTQWLIFSEVHNNIAPKLRLILMKFTIKSDNTQASKDQKCVRGS